MAKSSITFEHATEKIMRAAMTDGRKNRFAIKRVGDDLFLVRTSRRSTKIGEWIKISNPEFAIMHAEAYSRAAKLRIEEAKSDMQPGVAPAAVATS
jgi:hypothetical protein